METQNILLSIITILIGIVGYFVKKTLDKVEDISKDVSEMKPKVDILWLNVKSNKNN